MTRFNILAAAAALSLLTACGNTADGIKQDSENAAESTSEAAATAVDKADDAMAHAGESIDAAMETADVKSALMADTRVDAGDINVDTDENARTVTLNGSVPTQSMKTLAGEVAHDKAAGFTIVNNLAIKPA